MTRVAEKTGLERTHLYRKLKQLGVDLTRNKRGAAGAAAAGGLGYNSRLGLVAQLVEQRIENPRVGRVSNTSPARLLRDHEGNVGLRAAAGGCPACPLSSTDL